VLQVLEAHPSFPDVHVIGRVVTVLIENFVSDVVRIVPIFFRRDGYSM
jgi:hypothetical protein